MIYSLEIFLQYVVNVPCICTRTLEQDSQEWYLSQKQENKLEKPKSHKHWNGRMAAASDSSMYERDWGKEPQGSLFNIIPLIILINIYLLKK